MRYPGGWRETASGRTPRVSGYRNAVERFVTGPNTPAAARERAVEYFSDLVAGESASLLRLLVTEIVSEAVERAGDRRRVLELHLGREDGRLHIELTHAGAADEGLRNDLRRAILDGSAAQWGADDRAGGRLWFELDLPVS